MDRYKEASVNSPADQVLERSVRWTSASALAFGLATVVSGDEWHPLVSAVLLSAGVLAGTWWFWKTFSRNRWKGLPRLTKGEHVLTALLCFLFLMGLGKWEQGRVARRSILQTGEKTTAEVIEKRKRFEHRMPRYALVMQVALPEDGRVVDLDVGHESFVAVGEGDVVEVAVEGGDHGLKVASPDLEAPELGWIYWAMLFSALLGASWTEFARNCSGRETSGFGNR